MTEGRWQKTDGSKKMPSKFAFAPKMLAKKLFALTP
jgi:hypothetical protein